MGKMKYEDKIRFAEIGVGMLKEGSSREEIEDYLIKEGLKSWDIEKVNHSIDNHLNQEHKLKIKKYMLDNVLESKLSEFDDVDAAFFEKIQHEIIKEIKVESREKVKSLILEGKEDKEILEAVANSYFDEGEVYEVIDQEGGKKTEKYNQTNKGIGFIILGVLLSIFSADMIQGGFVVFYGLILYGLIILIKSKWSV